MKRCNGDAIRREQPKLTWVVVLKKEKINVLDLTIKDLT